MIPEKRKIPNVGDRQELMAEEMAGEMEGEELELGQERRRPFRPRPPEEIPAREAPALETSEGSTLGVELGEAAEVPSKEPVEEKRPRVGRRRSPKTAEATARRGRPAAGRGKRQRASTRRKKGAASRSS